MIGPLPESKDRPRSTTPGRRGRRLRSRAGLALLVGGSLFLPGPRDGGAEAQEPIAAPYDLRAESYVGAGYLANLPNVATGIHLFHVVRNGWGYFVDAKHTLDSRRGEENFMDGMSLSDAEALGHLRFTSETAYTSVNAGVIRAVHPEIALYAGAGYTSRDAFQGFRDPTEEMGDAGGNYFVLDDGDTRSGVNATGGILIQGSRNLFFRLGGELFPAGANVGIALALPR